MRASGEVQAGFPGTLLLRAAGIFGSVRTSMAILVRRPRPTPAAFIPLWRRLTLQALLAAGAIVLSMVALDTSIFELASRLPAWAVDLSYEITDFGQSGWVLVPCGSLIAVIAILGSRTLTHFTRAVLAAIVVRLGFVFIAVGLPGLLVTIVKRWIGRVRPSSLGPFAYEPFSWRPDFASLPSGHATTAFATLVAVGAVLPRARPLLWTFALLIAVSRVAVSAHFLSDVISGAVIGTLGALWVRDWFATRRLGFHVAPNGSIKPHPGPSLRRIKRVAAALFAP